MQVFKSISGIQNPWPLKVHPITITRQQKPSLLPYSHFATVKPVTNPKTVCKHLALTLSLG